MNPTTLLNTITLTCALIGASLSQISEMDGPSCSVPFITNGTLVIIESQAALGVDSKYVPIGTEMLLFCDEGFTSFRNKSHKFVCLEDGEWDRANEILCVNEAVPESIKVNTVVSVKKTKCEIPNINRGSISLYTKSGLMPISSSTRFVGIGVWLRIHCDITESDELAVLFKDGTCLENGTWSTDFSECHPSIASRAQKSVDMVTFLDTSKDLESLFNEVENTTMDYDELPVPEIEAEAENEAEIEDNLVEVESILNETTTTPLPTTTTQSSTTVRLTTKPQPTTTTKPTTTTQPTTTTTTTQSTTTTQPVTTRQSTTTTQKTTTTKFPMTTHRSLNTAETLFSAIESEELSKVKLSINSSYDELLESRNKNHETPLIMAARIGSLPIVEFLLNIDADIDAKDHQGRTALYIATQSGHVDVVETLCYAHADIDVRDTVDRKTPLLWAARLGFLDLVKLLIDKKADYTIRDDEEGSAIHIAAANGYADIVDYLLEKNFSAMFEARTKNFETPLMVAASHGRINVVGRLITDHKVPLETKTPYNKTALMKAVINNQLSVVKLLIRSGANVSTLCLGDRTALFLAVENQFNRAARYLATIAPALIEQINEDGIGPLYLAASTGQTELVQYFVEQGANVARPAFDSGRTALHAAAENGFIQIASLLATRKPGIIWQQSHPKDNGDMAIHLAVRNNQLEMVKLLITLDSQQLEAQNLSPQTPLQLAAIIGDQPIVCYLATVGSDKEIRGRRGRTPLITAAALNHLSIVKCLVESGANATAKSSLQDSSITALHAAASNGSTAVIKYLAGNVSKNLLELRDSTGATPLISAVKAKKLNSAKILVELGAKLEATTYVGIKTALWIAASMGNKPMVKFLVESGADKEAVGEYGRTPLLAAAAAGHLEATEYLVENGANWQAVSGEIDGLNTALHLAAAFGRGKVAQYLAKAKPDLTNVLNKRGHTADELADLLWNKNFHKKSAPNAHMMEQFLFNLR